MRHHRHRADYSLVKFEARRRRQHDDRQQTVPMALRNLDYSEAEIAQIIAHIKETNTIVGAPGLKDEHLSIFDVAVGERAISHMGHIDMMSATQPFLSGAISKTVNMPNSATVDDIAEAYTRGWEGGLRPSPPPCGSKTAQALHRRRMKGREITAEDSTVLACHARLPVVPRSSPSEGMGLHHRQQ
jgi:ribonucleoside-diphosphate reductase alpha chain